MRWRTSHMKQSRRPLEHTSGHSLTTNHLAHFLVGGLIQRRGAGQMVGCVFSLRVTFPMCFVKYPARVVRPYAPVKRWRDYSVWFEHEYRE